MNTTISDKLTTADIDRSRRGAKVVRLVPAGCGQCERHAEREFTDTVPVQPAAAEAATSIGAEPGFSRMAPLVNVVFIVIAFSVFSVLAIVKQSKPALVVALCAGLPLAFVAAWALFARWRG